MGMFDSLFGKNKSTLSTSTGATFSGGDGSSTEKAVIIMAPNEKAGVGAEYVWIENKYPNWKLKMQSLMNVGGKFYDRMDIQSPQGQSLSLYFDISAFFGKS
jgi:hypothetical protein